MGKLLASLVLGFSLSQTLYAGSCDSIDKAQHPALYAKCIEALKSSVVSTGVEVNSDPCERIDREKNPIQYEYCKQNPSENAPEGEEQAAPEKAANLIHETSERIQPAVGKDLNTTQASATTAGSVSGPVSAPAKTSATVVAPAAVSSAAVKLAEQPSSDCGSIDQVKHPALFEACKATESQAPSNTANAANANTASKSAVAMPIDECQQIDRIKNPRIYDACVREREGAPTVEPVKKVVAKPADECKTLDKTKNPSLYETCIKAKNIQECDQEVDATKFPTMHEACVRAKGGNAGKERVQAAILSKDRAGCNHIDQNKNQDLYQHCVASTQEGIVDPPTPEGPKDTMADCTRTKLQEIVCAEGTYIFKVEDEGNKEINDVLRDIPSDVQPVNKQGEIFVDPAQDNQLEQKAGSQNVDQ